MDRDAPRPPAADPPLEPEQDAASALPDEDPRQSLTRATAVMSVGTTLSRLTGFVRLAAMAWAIGGAESKLPDTYNLANSMSNVVYQLVLGEILATVFVPVFVEYIRTKARVEAARLASTILSLAFVISSVFVAVTVLAAPWLIKIYTVGVDDPVLRAQQEEVGAFLLRLIMPQMIFYATGAVLTGLLDAHRRFAAPKFAPILNNLIVTATFVAFRFKNGSRPPDLANLSVGDKLLLGGGTTLGVIAMTMVLWPFVVKIRRGYRLGEWDWRHPAIRHVGGLAKFSFGYVIVNQIGLWVVYALANGHPKPGGVAAYQAAWVLYQLPYAIFAVSVMTYLVPKLAEHHVAGDLAAVRGDVSLGLRSTAFIVLPATAGFIALGEPIIRLLLEHGVFTRESTALFADTFVMMVVGLGAYAAFQQIMRAFYAMQDTKTPWMVNIACVGANIVAAIPLYGALGVPGLGLAHAISYLVGALVGGAILRRRLGGLDGRRLLISHARIGAAAVVTGLGAWAVARAVGDAVDLERLDGQMLQVGLAVAAGLVLYAAVARALRIDEFRPLAALVAGRLGRRRP